MTDPEITQADADQAASFLESWEPGPEMTVIKLDRAFARHRMEAEQRGRAEGAAQERAEIVAWLRRLASDEGQTFQGRNLAAQIAAMNFSDAIERGEHKRSE